MDLLLLLNEAKMKQEQLLSPLAAVHQLLQSTVNVCWH